MWHRASQITSPPGRAWRCRAIWLPMVPEGTKIAASMPTAAAASSSKRLTVGSSLKTSSPTSASAMARRISASGLVTVSERRSIRSMRFPLFPPSEPHPHRRLPGLSPLELEVDLGHQQAERHPAEDHRVCRGVAERTEMGIERPLAADEADADVGGYDRDPLGDQELGAVLVEPVGVGVGRARAGDPHRERG